MARMNRLADAVSSILTGVVTLTLILGLLLTPNFVVADDSPINPMAPVVVCAGCIGGCGGTNPCAVANKKCNPAVLGGCTAAGTPCGCDDKVKAGTCACEG